MGFFSRLGGAIANEIGEGFTDLKKQGYKKQTGRDYDRDYKSIKREYEDWDRASLRQEYDQMYENRSEEGYSLEEQIRRDVLKKLIWPNSNSFGL